MKRLFLTLLCLLALCNIADARMLQGIAGAVTSCSSDSGDLYNQGFELGEEPSGWSHSGTSYSYGASRPGTDPGTCCSKSLRVNPSAESAYVQLAEGTARTETYVRFYMYIASTGSMSSNAAIYYQSNNALLGGTFALSCYDTGTVSCRVYGASNGSWETVAVGAWNRIEIHAIKNGAVTLRVNGVDNTTDGTAYNTDISNYQFGGDGSQTFDVYFDEFAISTTGWIGAP